MHVGRGSAGSRLRRSVETLGDPNNQREHRGHPLFLYSKTPFHRVEPRGHCDLQSGDLAFECRKTTLHGGETVLQIANLRGQRQDTPAEKFQTRAVSDEVGPRFHKIASLCSQ